jgi:hypothetical protein
MFDVEKRIAEAQEEFNRLAAYVCGEAQSHDAYVVERRVFVESRKMLLSLLGAYFAAKAGGDVGPAVATEAGAVLPRERLKGRDYVTIFGELELHRHYYHEDGLPGVLPLDEDTNLPRRSYSYFVQEFLGRRVARMTYEEALAELEQLFGIPFDKHNGEKLMPELAQDADAYYQALGTPSPETEAEVLVCAVDGKGVPIVKDEPAEHKVRLGRGEKRSRKKEAVVTAVYTIVPQPRTVEDVIREVRDKETPAAPRPRPQNKHVRATLKGKEDAITWMRDEAERRDPERRKKRVCLMDGSQGLWTLALALLPGFTFILDLFHVLEYLWKAAYVFHPEGSPEAEAFVRHRLRMLLEGQVGYVIGGLRQMLLKHTRTLHADPRKTLSKVIAYYDRNRRWMRYDAYLAAGYPIGSGAVEGACRHLVKDRMEGSGMRWTPAGAEAVLKLRAAHLNGDWDAFWAFHMCQETQRRFTRRWVALSTHKRQKRAA